MKNKLTVLLTVLSLSVAQGQSNGQLWLEYMLNYSFANSFNLENAFAYSTTFSKPKWHSVDYTPTLDYALFDRVDLSAAVTLSYTAQTEDYNSFELRPMLGTRVHITPHRRVLLRILARVEQRNFRSLETKQWEQAYRPRIRLESLIPINRKSYFDDNLWYSIMDIEWLFTSEDVAERFANRFRVRAGIGYRLNYVSRFELIYMNQQSRNGIDDDFTSNDNVIRLRYRQYIQRQKSEKLSGSGN